MPPAKQPAQPKPKSRVTHRMKEAMGAVKVRNRSADLMKLQEQYAVFVKKLKSLLVVLRNHHGSMMELQKTRLAVADAVAKMSDRSPIYECIGELPSPDRPPEQVCSYLSIHTKVADKSKSYISKYAQFVIEYVVEWEKVITGRISVGLKKAEELRVDLDHYQQKVESLRQSANVSMAKGKMVDSKASDRLSRNEEKFIKSKQEYDVFATDLCILIEEVTDRSWRDLHPLLIKLAQFDLTMSDDESKMCKQLNNVVKSLKDVASQNKLSPQPRLKDIEHQKPEVLNTRPGGDLRIEGGSGEDDGSVFGTTGAGATAPVALPPGTVAPQGLGGFPVQVADNDNSAAMRARTNSHTSDYSGGGSALDPSNPYGVGTTPRTMRSAPNSMGGTPSTSDIVNMSASSAPPPTMDQLNDAYSSVSLSGSLPPGSAPGSGGLPPLGPTTTPGGGGFGDSGSAYGGSAYGGAAGGGGGSAYGNNDSLTVYSGASAPAPAAPPPPPPMAPPPPPSGGQAAYPPPAAPPAPGYGGYPQQPGYPGYPPAPAHQPHHTTSMQPYGMAPQQPPPAYGAPPPPAYGAPPPPAYGAPPPPAYGAPPPPAYGAPPPPHQHPPQHAQSWGSAPSGGAMVPHGGTPLNSANPYGQR